MVRKTDEYEGMIAETVAIRGFGDDYVHAYLARSQVEHAVSIDFVNKRPTAASPANSAASQHTNCCANYWH